MRSHTDMGFFGDVRQSSILKVLQMIQDVTLTDDGKSGATTCYRTARCCNPGSVTFSGKLRQPWARWLLELLCLGCCEPSDGVVF